MKVWEALQSLSSLRPGPGPRSDGGDGHQLQGRDRAAPRRSRLRGTTFGVARASADIPDLHRRATDVEVWESRLLVVLSPTGNHQNRRNDHHRDEDEYNDGQENFIQHLIKHDDGLPR